MGLFRSKIDINEELKVVRATSNSLIVDVREMKEYNAGHIPGAYNLPLSCMKEAAKILRIDEDVPVYVYCQSGFRSKKAAAILKAAGYPSVKSIGGINGYKGKLE